MDLLGLTFLSLSPPLTGGLTASIRREPPWTVQTLRPWVTPTPKRARGGNAFLFVLCCCTLAFLSLLSAGPVGVFVPRLRWLCHCCIMWGLSKIPFSQKRQHTVHTFCASDVPEVAGLSFSIGPAAALFMSQSWWIMWKTFFLFFMALVFWSAAFFHWANSSVVVLCIRLYTRWKMWRYFCFVLFCLWPQLCVSPATVFITGAEGDGTQRVTWGDKLRTNQPMEVSHWYLSETRQMNRAQSEREKVVSISCLCPWCVSICHSLKPSLTGASLSFPVLCFSSSGAVILLVLMCWFSQGAILRPLL